MNKFSAHIMAIAGLIGLCMAGQGEAITLLVPSSQYPTIQAAVDAAEPGDTIQIANGVYTGTVDITGKTNLLLKGASRLNTIIRPASTMALGSGFSAGVVVRESENIRFETLQLDCVNLAGGFLNVGIYIIRSDEISLHQCVLQNMSVSSEKTDDFVMRILNTAGNFDPENLGRVQISQCEFYNTGHHAITAEGLTDLHVHNSIFRKSKGAPNPGYGIFVFGSANALIEDSVFSGYRARTISGTQSFASAAIALFQGRPFPGMTNWVAEKGIPTNTVIIRNCDISDSYAGVIADFALGSNTNWHNPSILEIMIENTDIYNCEYGLLARNDNATTTPGTGQRIFVNNSRFFKNAARAIYASGSLTVLNGRASITPIVVSNSVFFANDKGSGNASIEITDTKNAPPGSDVSFTLIDSSMELAMNETLNQLVAEAILFRDVDTNSTYNFSGNYWGESNPDFITRVLGDASYLPVLTNYYIDAAKTQLRDVITAGSAGAAYASVEDAVAASVGGEVIAVFIREGLKQSWGLNELRSTWYPNVGNVSLQFFTYWDPPNPAQRRWFEDVENLIAGGWAYGSYGHSLGEAPEGDAGWRQWHTVVRPHYVAGNLIPLGMYDFIGEPTAPIAATITFTNNVWVDTLSGLGLLAGAELIIEENVTVVLDGIEIIGPVTITADAAAIIQNRTPFFGTDGASIALNSRVAWTAGDVQLLLLLADEDKGTTTNGWDTVIDLGVRGIGRVNDVVTGLVPGETYHFRLAAVLASDTDRVSFSASRSFTLVPEVGADIVIDAVEGDEGENDVVVPVSVGVGESVTLNVFVGDRSEQVTSVTVTNTGAQSVTLADVLEGDDLLYLEVLRVTGTETNRIEYGLQRRTYQPNTWNLISFIWDLDAYTMGGELGEALRSGLLSPEGMQSPDLLYAPNGSGGWWVFAWQGTNVGWEASGGGAALTNRINPLASYWLKTSADGAARTAVYLAKARDAVPTINIPSGWSTVAWPAPLSRTEAQGWGFPATHGSSSWTSSDLIVLPGVAFLQLRDTGRWHRINENSPAADVRLGPGDSLLYYNSTPNMFIWTPLQ